MVYFISDTHLGASYIPDAQAHERELVALLRSMEADATDLYMLGDMLDFWFEYRYVVPRGFIRFFGALARLADAGVKLHWVRGNHDMWIADYLPGELGMEVIDGPVTRDILGSRFLLDHGDAVGERPRAFKMLRAIFRNGVCRRLYAAVHPRWTMALAHGWSARSRKANAADPTEAKALECLAEEPLVQFAAAYVAAHQADPVRWIVTGHRHIMLEHRVEGSTTTLVVLGDWLHHRSYAAYDGTSLTLRRYRPD